MLNNAFFKLEHDLADVQKAQVELPRLTELQVSPLDIATHYVN